MTDSPPPSDPSLDELALALRAAHAPETVDAEAAHARALARALEHESLAEAHPPLDPELAGLEEALRAAHSPAALDPHRHEALLTRALQRPHAEPPRSAARAEAASPAGQRWAWAAGLSMAAVLLLAIGASWTPEPPLEAPLTARTTSDPPLPTERSRSTEPLIWGATRAAPSTRATRIAQARAGDYRRNRFVAWGTP